MGLAPDPQEIKEILDKNPDIKIVYTTLCETSTGTVYDIKTISEITKKRNVHSEKDKITAQVTETVNNKGNQEEVKIFAGKVD